MNFTYLLGFVVLRDLVKVFPVSSSSFTRKTTGRNRGRSHSGAWRGLKTKWDLKWGLFIKMATDWQVSEVGDTCRAAAGPGQRRSVQIEWFSAGTAHLGFPALLSVPHLLSREIKMNRRHCLFRVRRISSDTCLSKSEQQLPSSSLTLSSSDRSGAWIFSHFQIQVRSADECVAPGRRQPRETRWTSDGRLSSPETNLKVGLLPLFFMQLLLSHMFLPFMVRTSPLTENEFCELSGFKCGHAWEKIKPLGSKVCVFHKMQR